MPEPMRPAPPPTEQDLLAWIACAQTILEELETPADDNTAIDFLRLYGVAVQAIRAAGAYALLHVAGHGRAGNPCARTALQGGVTAQWAIQRADGLDRLYEAAKTALISYYARHGRFDPGPEIAKSLDDARDVLRKEGKGVPTMTDMIAEVDSAGTLGIMYSQLSQFTHVTALTIASGYDGETGELHSDPADPFSEASLYIAGLGAMLALWPLSQMIDDATLQERLQKIAIDL